MSMTTCDAQLSAGLSERGLTLDITTKKTAAQLLLTPLMTVHLTHKEVVKLLRGYGVYVPGATVWTPECDQALHDAAQSVVQFWQMEPHVPIPTYLMTALEAALQEDVR